MASIEYFIGEKIFIQKPMVLGQLEELTDRLDELDMLEFDQNDVKTWFRKLIKAAPSFLAMVLRDEDGGRPAPEYLQDHMEIETVEAVINDFLSCNPTFSRLTKLKGILRPSDPPRAPVVTP